MSAPSAEPGQPIRPPTVVIECLGQEVGRGSTHRLVVVPGTSEELSGDSGRHTDLDPHELVMSVEPVTARGSAGACGIHSDGLCVDVH